jgi:hypothetical protein
MRKRQMKSLRWINWALVVLLWVDEYYSALAWRSHSIIPNIIRFYVLSENWVFYGNLYAECYSIVIDSSGGLELFSHNNMYKVGGCHSS